MHVVVTNDAGELKAATTDVDHSDLDVEKDVGRGIPLSERKIENPRVLHGGKMKPSLGFFMRIRLPVDVPSSTS